MTLNGFLISGIFRDTHVVLHCFALIKMLKPNIKKSINIGGCSVIDPWKPQAPWGAQDPPWDPSVAKMICAGVHWGVFKMTVFGS